MIPILTPAPTKLAQAGKPGKSPPAARMLLSQLRPGKARVTRSSPHQAAIPPAAAIDLLSDQLNQLDLEVVLHGNDRIKANGLSAWSVLPHSQTALAAGARLATARPERVDHALVTRRQDGKLVLEISEKATIQNSATVDSIKEYRQARWAMRLELDANADGLVRFRHDGKKFSVRNGVYPFVIDQNGAVLIPLAGGSASSQSGGHAVLTGGLGVLFAGELTIGSPCGQQRVLFFNNKSGNYLTPAIEPLFEKQARQSSVLKDAYYQLFSATSEQT